MFGLRLTSDDQKRSKKGQPPQRTTGVARKNSIAFRTGGARGKPSDSPSMESSKTGSDNAALIQKRKRIESHSGSASTSAKTSIRDRKSTRLNSSHLVISYAVFCLKKKQ